MRDEIESDRSVANWLAGETFGRETKERERRTVDAQAGIVGVFKIHKNLQSQFHHVEANARRLSFNLVRILAFSWIFRNNYRTPILSRNDAKSEDAYLFDANMHHFCEFFSELLPLYTLFIS